jgi:hypothetical protein
VTRTVKETLLNRFSSLKCQCSLRIQVKAQSEILTLINKNQQTIQPKNQGTLGTQMITFHSQILKTERMVNKKCHLV